MTDTVAIRYPETRREDVVDVLHGHMKGKRESGSVRLHPKAQEAISVWIESMGEFTPQTYLFQSREGRNQPISRVQAAKILKAAYAANELPELDRLWTHSLRNLVATVDNCISF